jgi:hypothetical protein
MFRFPTARLRHCGRRCRRGAPLRRSGAAAAPERHSRGGEPIPEPSSIEAILRDRADSRRRGYPRRRPPERRRCPCSISPCRRTELTAGFLMHAAKTHGLMRPRVRRREPHKPQLRSIRTRNSASTLVRFAVQQSRLNGDTREMFDRLVNAFARHCHGEHCPLVLHVSVEVAPGVEIISEKLFHLLQSRMSSPILS